MKALLITASLVGAAVAGLIIYFRRDIEAASELDRDKGMSLLNAPEERNMQYTMG